MSDINKIPHFRHTTPQIDAKGHSRTGQVSTARVDSGDTNQLVVKASDTTLTLIQEATWKQSDIGESLPQLTRPARLQQVRQRLRRPPTRRLRARRRCLAPAQPGPRWHQETRIQQRSTPISSTVSKSPRARRRCLAPAHKVPNSHGKKRLPQRLMLEQHKVTRNDI